MSDEILFFIGKWLGVPLAVALILAGMAALTWRMRNSEKWWITVPLFGATLVVGMFFVQLIVFMVRHD